MSEVQMGRYLVSSSRIGEPLPAFMNLPSSRPEITESANHRAMNRSISRSPVAPDRCSVGQPVHQHRTCAAYHSQAEQHQAAELIIAVDVHALSMNGIVRWVSGDRGRACVHGQPLVVEAAQRSEPDNIPKPICGASSRLEAHRQPACLTSRERRAFATRPPRGRRRWPRHDVRS